MKLKIAIGSLLTASLLAATAATAAPADLAIDLEQLWPHQDGNYWEYEQTYELAPWMPTGPDTTTTTVGLHFNGTISAVGKPDLQNLAEEVPVAAAPGPVVSTLGTSDAFLRTLWMVRPDLRSTLPAGASPSAGAPADVATLWAAVLLHGGAFELTTEEITTWRTSLIMAKSWVFVTSSLTQVGDSFQLQLVPDLAPDVYLTGTFAGFENVTVPAGTFQCLRMDYLVDYGTSVCTSASSPDSLGTFRAETTGSVFYASGLGPVRSEEELTYHEVVGSCGVIPDEVGQRVVVELTSSTVPARPTTWGRMKTRYLPEGGKASP